MSRLPSHWFGDFTLEMNHTLRWRVGPLTFWVHHRANEWRLHSHPGGDPLSASTEMELMEEHQVDVDDDGIQRFLVSTQSSRLTISVLLPDRPIVAKPASPVNIPAGQSVKFYLSYPVWLRIAVGEPAIRLTEIPTQRLSDTWFGPNTREGSLCYATRSRCRLSLSEHPYQPNRTITPLVIRNEAADTLSLDKVRLPVATLSLYRTRELKWLWTQPVTLVREERGDMAELRLDKESPIEAGPCDMVAQPREAPQRNTIFRAFSQLF